MDRFDTIIEFLQKGDTARVVELVEQSLNDGHSPREILDKGLIAGMAIVGQRFKEHKIFLPHVLLAARSMQAGIDKLKPHLVGEESLSLGRVIIGTVHGDLHDIGKNLVGIMLKGAGFEVIDLGKDVTPQKFIDAAIEQKANVIGMSALLTTTMPVMKQVVELAREKGVYDRLKFVVGGAPLSHDYAAEIGAHAYCFDGVSAVEAVKSLIGIRS